MKKQIAILTAFILALCFLCSCGIAKTEGNAVLEPDYDEPAVAYEEEYEEPEETPEEISREVQWNTFEHTVEDTDGYVIREKMVLSNWISYDNDYDFLMKAWEEVGKDRSLPEPGSLGISGSWIENTQYNTWMEFDEVMYSVGYIEAYNETTGFDIDESNPYSVYFVINFSGSKAATLQVLYSNGSDNYGIDNGNEFLKGEGNHVDGKMTTNHWGTVPIVIAYAIDKTPNDPLGSPAPANVNVGFYGDMITLGSGVAPSPMTEEMQDLIGVYSGTYINSSGETATTIDLNVENGILKGIFNFSSSNDNVSGAYFMTVDEVEDGVYRMIAEQWIDKPENYVTIPVWYVTLDGDTLSGSRNPGMSEITLTATR